MARSRRALSLSVAERNPGEACWQMLFPAFQPQTTGQIKKVTSSERSRRNPEDAYLAHAVRSFSTTDVARLKPCVHHPNGWRAEPQTKPQLDLALRQRTSFPFRQAEGQGDCPQSHEGQHGAP